MGKEIQQKQFTEQDFQHFNDKLKHNIQQLETLLETPGFGLGKTSIGAELEMYVVDLDGSPLYINEQLLRDLNDPQLTMELNRYNLEFNLTPYPLERQALFATEHEILEKLANLQSCADKYSGRIVPIGILPTLREADFGPQSISSRQRYHLLLDELKKRREGQFDTCIEGPSGRKLRISMADIALEGANTSFQLHYRVNPDDFSDTYNAFQLIMPLVLAISTNSPLLFGRELWHETRIPLFKQSIDTRRHADRKWQEPARVNYGHGWLWDGALQLFREAVSLYEPLLPECSAQHEAINPPKLTELRLHMSTIWLWNRPVYDDTDGGHLRIELRALPAGPTPVDMMANATFAIGLAEGLKPQLAEMMAGLPFKMADHNFHRAAQFGPQAQLIWPRQHPDQPRERAVLDIVKELLPIAQQGLESASVSAEEIDHYLGVIEHRVQTGQTGSVWQKEMLARLGDFHNRKTALHMMLEQYIQLSRSNTPVAHWAVDIF